jgi:hypothetical protein
VIGHPMDFATVRKKLANGSYSSLEQFEVCTHFLVLLCEFLIMWLDNEEIEFISETLALLVEGVFILFAQALVM